MEQEIVREAPKIHPSSIGRRLSGMPLVVFNDDQNFCEDPEELAELTTMFSSFPMVPQHIPGQISQNSEVQSSNTTSGFSFKSWREKWGSKKK